MIQLLSFLPFALFVFLMIWKKTSLRDVSLLILALTAGLVLFYWKIPQELFFVSLGKGFFVALDILIIVLGAIFFLEILNRFKIIQAVSYYLESFSKDYRVQIILLAWFFENFIEGTAGFGTPGAIVGPLLVGLGLPVLQAAIIALLGNSASVVFGAAGAPIRIGFQGLETGLVPYYASLINIAGFIVPIFMLWTAVANKQDSKKQFFEALPFAVWAGLAFSVPSFLVIGLGQEFPSIIGAIIGVILVFITTKLGIFVPKQIRSFQEGEKPKTSVPLSKTIFPYALLIAFLILGKIFLSNAVLKVPFINHNFAIFNPGFAFIISAIFVLLAWENKEAYFLPSIKTATSRSVEPFLVILSMSAIVQLMINSGQNLSGLPSMVAIIAKNFETQWLPMFAPFVGAFGSFLTGSATVSNLLFGSFFNFAAKELLMDPQKILALGVIGGAAGNMAAIADIMAAETVLGLKHKEREIIRGVLWPCLTYLLFVGILGMFFV